MSPHNFLRATLAAPILLPMVALASGSRSGVAFLLVMSLVFGLVPYLIVAVILWLAVARCDSQRSAIRLILIAPLLFAAVQSFAWLVWSWLTTTGGAGMGGALSAYGLLLGYIYSTLAILLLVGARRLGLVTGFPDETNKSSQVDAA